MNRRFLSIIGVFLITVAFGLQSDAASEYATTPQRPAGIRAFIGRVCHILMVLRRKSLMRFSSPARSSSPPSGSSCEAQLTSALVRCSPDSDVTITNQTQIELASGELMLVSKQPVVLNVSRHRVYFDKDVIASVTTKRGVLSIRNLSESHYAAIKACLNGSCFKLGAGQELLLAHGTTNLQSAAAVDRVQRRKPHLFAFGNGDELLSSEFSLVDVIRSSPLFSAMVKSGSKQDRIILGRITKTAACLAIATANHGHYQPVAQ